MTERKTSAKSPPSQVMELLFHLAGLLGDETDREVAELCGVSPEAVAGWRSGAVRELKPQTLRGIKSRVQSRFDAMRERLREARWAFDLGLLPIEIEEGSGPAALQRQFQDRVPYDYLGHRFLYFEPQGALAWENLIKGGYEQGCWLRGVEACLDEWLKPSPRRSADVAPLMNFLGLEGRGQKRDVDIVSLGPGEGGKEEIVGARILDAQRISGAVVRTTLALVDVSIPLLMRATQRCLRLLYAHADEAAARTWSVLAMCADFEEGELGFTHRLPSGHDVDRGGPGGVDGGRLVLLLGNTFGNLRDESNFVDTKLAQLVRPGDLVWMEVGLRLENDEDDPLHSMTQETPTQTAAGSHRRLLLEGPYRRWLAASGRQPQTLDTRIWMRERDDSSRVPGSINYCHDLVIADERRVCTMLYSRRYELESLKKWLEPRGYEVVGCHRVADSESRQRVAHLLLRRR